ncbi:MAG: hypothetical protein J5483_04005, partial [Lachnospiraceae bacterium]|nr:hypothetical protein [Lachnospiraceae bacterium]
MFQKNNLKLLKYVLATAFILVFTLATVFESGAATLIIPSYVFDPDNMVWGEYPNLSLDDSCSISISFPALPDNKVYGTGDLYLYQIATMDQDDNVFTFLCRGEFASLQTRFDAGDDLGSQSTIDAVTEIILSTDIREEGFFSDVNAGDTVDFVGLRLGIYLL